MDNKEFISESFKSHNVYREKHGVPALKLNDGLSEKAQKWADHMAETGAFEHCKDRNFEGQTLGENIAMKWTSSGDDFTGNSRHILI